MIETLVIIAVNILCIFAVGVFKRVERFCEETCEQCNPPNPVVHQGLPDPNAVVTNIGPGAIQATQANSQAQTVQLPQRPGPAPRNIQHARNLTIDIPVTRTQDDLYG